MRKKRVVEAVRAESSSKASSKPESIIPEPSVSCTREDSNSCYSVLALLSISSTSLLPFLLLLLLLPLLLLPSSLLLPLEIIHVLVLNPRLLLLLPLPRMSIINRPRQR